MRPITPTPATIDRFLRRFDPSSERDCWLWLGGKNAHGYGQLYVGKRNGFSDSVLAHRFSYTYHVGPIPEGLVIDHLCGNRSCVNPTHLEPVTQSINAQRANPASTHCRRGHEFTPENTRFAPKRKCRECERRRQREAYRRKVGK